MSEAGKRAIVTGAGGGIGRAVAMLLAGEGARLVLADIDETGLAGTVAMVREHGGTVVGQRCDVASDGDCRSLVETCVGTFGGMDMAFNNAGIDGDVLPIVEQDMGVARRVLEVNVMGVLQGMRHQIPAMIASGGGSIVNTASIAGVRGHPGLGPYVASKHAVVGLSRTAAIEAGPQGVRVNALCPGGVRTPMLDEYLAAAPDLRAAIIDANPMRRLGETEELARAAVWLASAAASYINGHALVVDGGKIVSDV